MKKWPLTGRADQAGRRRTYEHAGRYRQSYRLRPGGPGAATELRRIIEI